MKRRLALALALCCVAGFGAQTLLAAGGDPGPPCIVDDNIQCLDVWMPVSCVKPGQGWKVYSNSCYAMKDCALMRTCVDLSR